MDDKIKAFEHGLATLKEEIDGREATISELNKEMDFHKPSVVKFHECKEKKKTLIKEKKEKQKLLESLISFYKETTGEEPDGMYPLFQNRRIESNGQEA